MTLTLQLNDLQPDQKRLAEQAMALPENDAYRALVAKAEELGWPESYQNDLLVHDRLFVCDPANQGKPFVWGVRPWGTHIVPRDEAPLYALERPGFAAHVTLDYMERNETKIRWFRWDGVGLAEVTVQEAREFTTYQPPAGPYYVGSERRWPERCTRMRPTYQIHDRGPYEELPRISPGEALFTMDGDMAVLAFIRPERQFR